MENLQCTIKQNHEPHSIIVLSWFYYLVRARKVILCKMMIGQFQGFEAGRLGKNSYWIPSINDDLNTS